MADSTLSPLEAAVDDAMKSAHAFGMSMLANGHVQQILADCVLMEHTASQFVGTGSMEDAEEAHMILCMREEQLTFLAKHSNGFPC